MNTKIFENSKTEEMLTAIKEPFVERRLRSMIESYRDSQLEKMTECVNTYIKSLENIKNWNVDEFKKIITNRGDYEKYKDNSLWAEKVFTELFGKPMDNVEIITMEEVAEMMKEKK